MILYCPVLSRRGTWKAPHSGRQSLVLGAQSKTSEAGCNGDQSRCCEQDIGDPVDQHNTEGGHGEKGNAQAYVRSQGIPPSSQSPGSAMDIHSSLDILPSDVLYAEKG
jgi:hypothetical protein